jgi:hypothetical protein
VRRLAQPEGKRHRAPDQIIIQAAECLQFGFLNDIGGIESAPQSAVQSHRDDAVQFLMMPLEERVERAAVPLGDLLQEPRSFRRIGEAAVHGVAILPRKVRRRRQKFFPFCHSKHIFSPKS